MRTLAPAVVFLLGFLLAELREGWIRLAGLWAMIAAAGHFGAGHPATVDPSLGWGG